VFQTTLDQGVPLSEVTFCVVDLETTGGSPASSAITEIGAVKYRGGELLGTFSELVDPGVAIPPFITRLTGIADRDVIGMPPIEAIMPQFVEFAHDTVFVAHNARFDLSFVNAELLRLDYEPIPPPPVCTARLARRVVWPDVPNVKLATLAQYFRVAVQPSHRALPDAQACAEVLHGLLELGGRLGILTLGDLHNAVRARGRPNFHKIRMTDDLPRSPGVYLFRGRDDQILYVGKSKDIRQRVKTYFYGDGRKKIEDLLAEVTRVEARPCTSELEALVLEARLIGACEPKYNRRGKTWRRYAYLKLDTTEAFPRFKVVYDALGGEGLRFLGPFRSSSQARLTREALEEVFPIRRCTKAMRERTRFAPCALADMGRCLAPCDGRTDRDGYLATVERLLDALSDPDTLLEMLEVRMNVLARAERFEEASLARDRLRATIDALTRERTNDWLLQPGHFVLRDATGAQLMFRDGQLAVDRTDPSPIPAPVPRERADEIAEVRRWLARNPVRLEASDRAIAEPIAEPVAGGAALQRLRVMFAAAERVREDVRAR